MSDRVWVSDAIVHRTDVGISGADGDRRVVAAIRDAKKGIPMPAQLIPKRSYAVYKDKDYSSIPNYFFNGLHAVHNQIAEIIASCDVGCGGVYPTEIYAHDRVTLLNADYSYVDFGNTKTAFDPSLSRANPNEYSPGTWELPQSLKDGEFYVDRSALDGPDLWLDPRLPLAFFFSDQLVQKLKAIKADKIFRLKYCEVV